MTFLHQAIEAAMKAGLAEVHTFLPAAVDSFNSSTLRAAVRPLVPRVFSDGHVEPYKVLSGVPVAFQGGDGAALLFPVASGNFGLLLFAEACLERYLADGTDGDPADPRRHALCDVIFVPAPAFPSNGGPGPWDGQSLLLKLGDARLRLAGGKVAIGNSTAELLDLIDQIIGRLQSTIVNTAVGSYPLMDQSGASLLSVDLTTIKTLLAAIKGTL